MTPHQSRGFLLLTALRETRANLSHFRILILCLFLGVFVIGFVQSVTLALENGLRRDGKAILGGDFSVRNIYQPLADEPLAALNAVGRIARTVEMRGLLTDEPQMTPSDAPDDAPDDTNDDAKAGDANTGHVGLSEIKAVDNVYPLFGQMTLERAGVIETPHEFLTRAAQSQDGAEIPAVLLDNVLAERLNVKIGDIVKIGNQRFVFADIILHEPDRAGGSTFNVGPRSMMRIEDLDKTGLVQTGAQVYYHYKVAMNDPDTLLATTEAIEAKLGEGGWRLRDYTNASPRIDRFLSRLSQFFTLVGLSALLIGGVGIGNAVHVVLQKRLPSLAIAKSLGASRSFVFWLWFWVVMMAGLIGIVPALGLSFSLPFMMQAALEGVLPIPFVPTLAPHALGTTVLFGGGILVLFSVLPLSRAAQAKPALLFRQGAAATLHEKAGKKAVYATVILMVLGGGAMIALSSHPVFTAGFLAAAAAIYILLKAVSHGLIAALRRLHGLRNPALRMAVVNMTRPDNQSFTVLLSLGLSLTLFAAIAQIEMNVKHRIDEDIPDKAPAFFFIDIQKSQMPDFEAAVRAVEGVSDLTKVPNLRGKIVSVNGVEAEKALVDPSEDWLLRGDRGFTYLTEKPDYSDLLEGEWWAPDYSGPPIVSVVEDVARGFGVGVGDEITLNILGRDISARIVNVRSVDWSTMTINYAITFAPGALDNAPHSYLATLVAPQEVETKILSAVAQDFANVTAIQVRDALQTASMILGRIALAMRAIAGLALVTGVLVLAASLLSSLRQRRYETVVMKVVGAQRRTLTRMMVYEFALLGGIAAAISLLTGTACAYLVVTQVMEFPWIFDLGTAVTVVVLSLSITLAFAVWAVWSSLSSRPGDFLRNE